MTTQDLQQEFLSLVALTKLYLLQDYSLDARIATDSETFLYFKNQALQQKEKGTGATNAQLKQEIAPQMAPRPLSAPQQQSMPTQPKSIISLEKTIEPVAKATETTAKPALIATPTSHPKKKVEEKPQVIAPATQPAKSAIDGVYKKIALEPPVVVEGTTDFTSIKNCITKVFPNYSLSTDIPSDEEAKRLSMLWMTEQPFDAAVAILMGDLPVAESELIKRLCEAINQRLAPAAVVQPDAIEQKKGWEQLLAAPSLRLITTTRTQLKQLKNLCTHYRQIEGAHHLGHIPLLLMEEISLYTQDPQRKAALWHSLSAFVGKK
jgi:hypothetical protein